MGEKDERESESLTVSRRDFVRGVAVAGLGIGGGFGIDRLRSEDVGLDAPTNLFANEIYTGYSLLESAFPSDVKMKFLSTTEQGRVNLGVEVHEYPMGSKVAESQLALDIDARRKTRAYDATLDVDMEVVDSDVVDNAEVSGAIETPEGRGLYSWRHGGRMYNLVSGALHGGKVATLDAVVEAKLDDVDTQSPVVLTFTAQSDDRKHLIRQTQPFNPDAETPVKDIVSVPTDSRQVGEKPTDAGTFNRVSRKGRHVMWYIWEYKGNEYGIVYPVHKLPYANRRRQDSRYTHTAFEAARKNPYVQMVGQALYEMADSKGGDTEALAFNLARTFSQSFPYNHDHETHDQYHYPNYAEETLVEGVGDCEDKSVLLAGMLEQEPFNYDTALIFPPKHVAVGVAAEDIPVNIAPEDVTNAGVSVGDKRYVYVESTDVHPAGKSTRDLNEIRAVYADGWKQWRLINNGEGVIRYLREIFGERGG